MNKTRKQQKSLLWLVLGVLAVSFIIYAPFIFGDQLFCYIDANDDTFQSYLPAYQLIVQMLQSGTFSLYSVLSGMGANILSMQFVIFDPFAVIVYFSGWAFGANTIAYALVWAHIARGVGAALACYYFLSRFSFSAKEKTIASFTYAFSSFIVGGMGQHYMFATAPVFIALILGLIEHSRTEKRCTLLLSFVVAASAVWSVYFCYMLLLAGGIYAVIRELQQPSDFSVKKMFTNLVWLLISVVSGLLLAGVVLIPTAWMMLTISDRLSQNASLIQKIGETISAFKFSEVKTAFLRLFSNQIEGTMNAWQGANSSFNSPHIFQGLLVIIAIPQYFAAEVKKCSSRAKTVTLGFGIIIAASTFSYFAGTVFNAFVAYTPRYLFVVLPLFAYLTAWLLQRVFVEKQFFSLLACICGGVCSILVAWGSAWADVAARISTISVLVSLWALIAILCFAVLDRYRKKRYLYVGCNIILLLNIVIESGVALHTGRAAIRKSAYEQSYLDPAVDAAVEQLSMDSSRFLRLERNLQGWPPQSTPCYAQTQGYRGTSFYNSLVQKGLVRFRTDFLGFGTLGEMPEIFAAYYKGTMGTPFDKVLADLYGIRYIVSTVPITNSDWVLDRELADSIVYSNQDISSAGLLYTTWMNSESFNQLSALQKQAMLSQTVMIEGIKDTNIPQIKALQSPVEKQDMLKKQTLFSQKGTAVWKNNEIHMVSNKDKQAQISIRTNVEKLNLPKTQHWVTASVEVADEATLTLYCDTGTGVIPLDWRQYNQALSEKQKNTLLYKLPKDTQRISLAVYGSENIKIKDLQILSLDEEAVCYKNEGVLLENTSFGSNITGTVYAENDSILVVPVMMQEGWSVKVDGVPATVLTADHAFLAVELKAGNHTVEFYYDTPKVMLGVAASIAGGVLWLGLCIVLMRNRKRRIND